MYNVKCIGNICVSLVSCRVLFGDDMFFVRLSAFAYVHRARAAVSIRVRVKSACWCVTCAAAGCLAVVERGSANVREFVSHIICTLRCNRTHGRV